MRGFLSVLALALLFTNVSAQGTNSRSWVSGVGNDVNPCSRTAPCLTFYGALNATIPGGEINIIDPGDFEPVVIPQGVLIDGAGTAATLMVISGTGITIDAPGSVVILRNLDVYCTSNSSTGISIARAREVRIVNLEISNCPGQCIHVATPAEDVVVSVVRSKLQGCGVGILVDGDNTTSSDVILSVTDTEFTTNTRGIVLNTGSAAIANSQIDFTSDVGVLVGNGAEVNVINSVFNGNGVGLRSDQGSTVNLLHSSFVSGSETVECLGDPLQTDEGNFFSTNASSCYPTPTPTPTPPPSPASRPTSWLMSLL